MSYLIKIFIFHFAFLAPFLFSAQELPPIEKFSPEDYGGENQNWMISQASNNYIYIANSGGLLEFNGANWQLYPSPNNTIIRSVKAVDNKIYIGCFKEFGYYKKDTIGKLNYHSLVQKYKQKLIEDENIWNIRTYKEWILFQSQERIYFYNTKTGNFKIINSKNIITKVFNVNNTIYYHVINEGIYKIEHGAPALVVNNTTLKNDKVINIFTLDSQLLIQTRKSGFYVLTNNHFFKWKVPVNDFIKSMSVFNSIQLEDESFVLGTISNGIIHVNRDGTVAYQINQKNGLSNNTALSLFEDYDKNVWVGLDNGINCINVKSPIRIFNDDEGILGTVYISTIFDNYLYLGTNQGLFYKKLNDNNGTFKFIEGTSGQVWNLFVYNNDLFCAHHNGTFLIDKNKATIISSIPGTWGIKPIPNRKNKLLQGNYSGLYILQKENNSWRVKNKIEGFDNSARYFEINNKHQVWVSHGYKGVFKLNLNDNLTKVSDLHLEPELVIGKNSSLIKYKNDILYAYEGGVFKYDSIGKHFVYDSIFSQLIEKEKYISGKLVADKQQQLWAFSNDNINYLTIDNLTNTQKINQISIPYYLRKGMVGYENICKIKDKEYLLGTANGYIIIDLSKINYTKDYNIYLNSVSLKNIEKDEKKQVDKKINGTLDYKPGIITFNYSVPEYDKFLVVKYQYKLDGLFSNWTEWSGKPEVSFENLSFGNYTFYVRAKIGNKLSKNTVSYTFTINKPWYFSSIALIGYVLLFSFIILLTHRTYRKYYHKQLKLKQSANEELIVRIKNEKLKQDIESKNRELAISTMSIIKKNEVLSSIKKELKNSNHKDNSTIIKLIDKNLNNQKDWQFFEEAFNNADKHFLDKVKKAHPNLTPNDLRFCAYLRLNLSSKEIAPLLNISVRSVEIKRYRLRKKMNLTHDESLVNHILEI
jgi:DNA-binding CsgD family transcriptional regulator